jgi:hypothetical protein
MSLIEFSDMGTDQCCGSGSARNAFIFGRFDPNPDPHLDYGSGSSRAKMTDKSEENSSFKVLDVLF